jgi:hypothetical protein
MEVIDQLADPEAAATALLAAALAVCGASVALSAFACAFVAKELRTWWTLRHGDPTE